MPALVVPFVMLLFGWVLVAKLHASLGTVILALPGLEILTGGGLRWAYYGEDDLFGLDHIVFCIATGLTLLGIGGFVWRACKIGPYRRTQEVLGLLLFAALIAWWFTIPELGKAAVARRQAAEAAVNQAAMAQAVEQIEALRVRLGRIPTDDEVSAEPLPSAVSRNVLLPIRYQHGPNSYRLRIVAWDIYEYDSAAPAKGWCCKPF